MSKPLMPKATAVWLVDNTALTFNQIADFCGLHPLEVKGIADGDVAQGIKGLDPVANGQLTREELEKAEADPAYQLKLLQGKVDIPELKRRKGPRYTPLSRRQDRPDAISWLVRNHPELTDAQIAKLVGTTKPTIQSVRDRTHWNSPNIKPVDPVVLGLCSQIELDAQVQRAARRLEREAKKKAKGTKQADGATLLPTEESLKQAEPEPTPEPEPEPEPRKPDPTAENVFDLPATPSPAEEDEDGAITAEDVFRQD
jgi:hypothetical protein